MTLWRAEGDVPVKAVCRACGGEPSPTAITSEGVAYACPCGRTTWTQLAQGKLDVMSEKGK